MSLSDIPHRHYICTADQSQKLDQHTIEDFGISGYTLMEVAGAKSAGHILEDFRKGDHGIILCGKGNNGGDALVVARYLVQHGIKVTIVFISGDEDLSEDARSNYELLQKMNQHELHEDLIDFLTSWPSEPLAGNFDFIVDGMLGTGLDSELRGDYTTAVRWANQQPIPTYSIDIPTGLHADTGQIMGEAIRADQTFTFGGLKQGFYLNDGPSRAGQPAYCDLPFPNYLKQDFNTALIDESWVENTFPIPRKPARHKYEAGVLYVIAGSEGLTGAAIMAAKSAWSEGLGAVILICPHGLLSVFENHLTQVITRPVGHQRDTFFKADHWEEIHDILSEKPGTVIFGPGIGRHEETVDATHELINQFSGSMVIDADGLWCLAQREWEIDQEQDVILTPHPGEASRLFEFDKHDDADRLDGVRTFARQKGVHLLSKGYPVILGTPNGICYLTGYDTRRFSRAGFGDVLAGKIGAFWTLSNRADQACWHALVNGKKKMDYLENRSGNSDVPEPLDLI